MMYPLQNSTFKINGTQYKITGVVYGGIGRKQTVMKFKEHPIASYEFETAVAPIKRFKMGAKDFLNKINNQATEIKIGTSPA